MTPLFFIIVGMGRAGAKKAVQNNPFFADHEGGRIIE
jgi:hypothetical protein